MSPWLKKPLKTFNFYTDALRQGKPTAPLAAGVIAGGMRVFLLIKNLPYT